jgi:ubiquinone/menaquinone biosynthesis C-methylase UbiE
VLKRALVVLASIGVLLTAYVGEEAVRTLGELDRVEAERDTWQRPEAVVAQLGLRPGATAVDLGAGAGYFALKMASAVGPSGRVLAVDLRRESLVFLRMRAWRRGLPGISTIVGEFADPRLPRDTTADAVLIANTFHELSDPDPILASLAAHMRTRARLVVVDREERNSVSHETRNAHSIQPDVAEQRIEDHGFRLVHRDDIFINRVVDDDTWWMLVFEKP